MTNKIATEQYLINLAGGGTSTPTKCATKDRVEFFGLEANGSLKKTIYNYQHSRMISMSTSQ